MLPNMPSSGKSSPGMGARRLEFSFPHPFPLISDDLVSIFSVPCNVLDINVDRKTQKVVRMILSSFFFNTNILHFC